jgi:hypothetical protein
VRRIVFSIVLSRQPSPALLFFKLIEVKTKFLFAKSISEFSRNQDPKRTWANGSQDAVSPRTVIEPDRFGERASMSGLGCAGLNEPGTARAYI